MENLRTKIYVPSCLMSKENKLSNSEQQKAVKGLDEESLLLKTRTTKTKRPNSCSQPPKVSSCAPKVRGKFACYNAVNIYYTTYA